MQDNCDLYNNADSFGMIFDEAWKKGDINFKKNLDNEEKIRRIIDDNKEHPFVKNFPDKALDVARFRIRLLQLN